MGAKSGQSKRSAGVKRLGLVVFGVLFAGLFVGFAIAEGIGQPSVPAGDVALIEGVPSDVGHISEAQYRRALPQQLQGLGLKKIPKKGSEKYEELKNAALSELISTVWIRGEAEELGITVTDKQIENELATIKKENFPTEKQYQEFLKTSRLNQEEVNEKVELQVLSTKVQEKINAEAKPPSNSEIQDYYDAEKATQFTEPPTRDVRVIVNEKKSEVEKAKEALEKDNSGASWKAVAKKYSSDPTTNTKGGLQKAIPEELLQGVLKKAIYGSSINELVGPTKYQGNYLLTEVIKLNPEKVKSLGEVRSQISQTLSQQIQQQHFSEFVAEFQTKWTSRTFCASGYVIERCANYKPSGRPSEANPACYEANPKTPATECPAPVTQTKPAMPGTVSIVKPAGEQLVQRPVPETTAAGSATEALEGVEGAEGVEAEPEGAPAEGGAEGGE